jgi:integrase
MPKLNKKAVDAAMPKAKDYVIWDDDLPGFGLRVFASGKRSYVLQYRSKGRSRRYTIGLHGVWTPETARQEARVQLGRIAQGENPAEERQVDHQAITVRELCALYRADLEAGLILGKGGRPKRASTIYTDLGRMNCHIIPLIGTRRVRDLTKADANKLMKDVMAGRTKQTKRSGKLRGKSIVRGGPGAASRTVGLLGGILTYAIEAGIIDTNPAHGIRKPKDKVRQRRLSEDEYRMLGQILAEASAFEHYALSVAIIRMLALTGCRRGEIVNLKWADVDLENSCLRLSESKEGYSVRPIGLPVIEMLEARQPLADSEFVFPGLRNGQAFGALPNHWEVFFKNSALGDVTAHVLRHSFASLANDLGLTEVTIAALIGHAKGSVTSKYIHTMDSALVMAADTIAGYVEGLLDGKQFEHAGHKLDRSSRRASLNHFLSGAAGKPCDTGSHRENASSLTLQRAPSELRPAH